MGMNERNNYAENYERQERSGYELRARSGNEDEDTMLDAVKARYRCRGKEAKKPHVHIVSIIIST